MTDAVSTQAEVRDFTAPRKPFRFKIDDDEFVVPAKIATSTYKKLATMQGSFGGGGIERLDEQVKAIGDMFRLLMPGASGQRFAERLTADGSDESTPPIDLVGEALPVIYAILEHYGLRPTQPSLPSADGSTGDTTDTPNGGTFSTDGASPEDSDLI